LFLGFFLSILPLFLIFSKTLSIISPFSYMWKGLLFVMGNIKEAIIPIIMMLVSSVILFTLSYFIFKRRDL
jgi:putative exporter of polyketide antibiotics